MVGHVLGDARVVAAGEDEACCGALARGEEGKGADGEGDVLFALEAVDGEEDAAAVVRELWVGLDCCAAAGARARGRGRRVDAWVDDVRGGGDARESGAEDGFGEGAVDDDCVGEARGEGFEVVKGDAVEGFEEGGARGEEVVGEVAVEEDAGCGAEETQEGDAGAELVHKDVVVVLELRGQKEVQGEVQLAQNGAEDAEAAEEVWWEERVSSYADFEGACLRDGIVREL